MKKCLVLILLAGICSVANAQTDTAAISALLKQEQSKLGKQYAFAMFADGKQVYKKEAGLTLKTQQYIEDASEWITTALVLVMVQEGKINLDDKVSTYLPIFAKYGKAYITIRHCLTHNTGIDGSKAFQKNKFNSLEEEVDFFAAKREIKTNPGTEFNYSNIGYKIAARVLEIVSKKKFERLVKEKITTPLGMRFTSFADDNAEQAPDPSSGSSSAGDYLNFMAMLLNKGSYNGKQILTEASVKTLLSIHTTASNIKRGAPEGENLDFALGSWVIEKNAKGEPIAFMPLGTGDTFAILDICKGYAFVLFTYGNDIRKDLSLKIKSLIDEQMPAACK